MATSALEDGADVRPLVRLEPRVKTRLDPLIRKYARRHGVDEKLIRAVLRRESGGNPLAVSPKGALGLMQLMPATAESLGVKDAFDPEENLSGGVRYLKYCLNRFQQNVPLALAAYNAGPGAVEKYGGVPPYRETEDYVANITKAYGGKPWTKEVPAAPEPASVNKETGLKWNVPQPAWKSAAPPVKVAPPRWKVNSPELNQGRQPISPQSLQPLQTGGLKAETPPRQSRAPGASSTTP